MGVVCASGGQCLNAGYLTVQDTLDSLLGRYELRIPNKEIMSEFLLNHSTLSSCR